MLNEFKRSMWNDGYSKEQPWLNYYNSYERMHCCFGDDGGDGTGGEGTAGDEAASTGTTGPAAQTAAESQAAFSEALSGAVGSEYYDEERSSEKSALGMNAAQAQQVSDAIDRAAEAGANVKQQQSIAEGGNRGAAAGYEGDELGAIAAANIDEDFFSDKTMGSKTSGYGGFVDPFAFSGYGQTSFSSFMDELPDAISFFGENLGVTGFISAVARTAQALGKDEKDVTAQEISMVTGGQNYGGLREEGISSQQEKDSRGIAGAAIDPSYGGATLASDFDAMQQQADAERASAYLDMAGAEGSLSFDPTGIGAGYAAQSSEREELEELNNLISAYEDAEIGRSDTQLDRDISAYGEADEAMFGGNYAGQPDVIELRNVDSQDPEKIIKPPLPVAEAKVVPKTAMEEYFAKVGTPAIPSSFQEYRSYLPPIGPAANADYRRTLALGTPRYQEPSGPNRSIATLAAAYGLTYDEAAKRFAPPSVPKPLLDKPILFAASGGGLNSLMRYK